MSEWKETSLKEAISKANTGADAITRAPIVDYDSGIRCLRIQNVSNSHDFRAWGFCEISKENYPRFSLQKGDILIARTGNTIGVNIYIESDLVAVFNNGLIRLRFDTKKVISKYIYYVFKTSFFEGHIKSIAYGTSTQPNMQIESLLSFTFDCPPLQTQENIIKVLSCLDAKIENLRRQNETLEQIAQTLFKNWFIDFEFSNAEGKPYKSSGGAMFASELGDIPEGWKVCKFSTFFDLLNGGTPKTSIPEYWGGNIKWLSVKDITKNSKQFILDTEKTITEKGIQKSAAKLLPKYTTIVSARGTVGNYCLLSEKMAISQSSFGVYPKIGDCVFFGYLLMSSLIQKLQSQAYGSVFDTVTASTFNDLNIVLSELHFITKFELKINPIFQKQLLNQQQIQTLTKTRDSLLPKLMSGQLRVKE